MADKPETLGQAMGAAVATLVLCWGFWEFVGLLVKFFARQ